MDIRVLGCSGAIAKGNRTTSFLIDGRILVGGPMQAGRKICFKTGTSA